MFQFANPQYLIFLLLVPALLLIFIVGRVVRRRALQTFGDDNLVRGLMPDTSASRPWIKISLALIALTLVIIATAGPQFGTKLREVKRTGIELVVALDVSNSMLAEDITPNRLENAKRAISKMIDGLKDDKLALIVFAGDAFVQLPMTSDYTAAKMFLSTISPALVTNQGTALQKAIELGVKSFTPGDEKNKAIVIITDGEDHEGEALEAAAEAKSKGYTVYVLGIGSPRGTLVPDAERGGYMIDNAGNQVISALNEQMCSEVAQQGGGAYIHVVNNATAQRQLEDALDKLQKSEQTLYSDFDEQFQAVGIIALLLLILEVCILDRRNPALRKLKLFKK